MSESPYLDVALRKKHVENETIISQFVGTNQVVIAQWLAQRLATREVPGSNPGKGENLLISE